MASVKCTTVLVQVVGVSVKRGGVWIKLHADPIGVLSMRVQGEWVGGLSHYALTGVGNPGLCTKSPLSYSTANFVKPERFFRDLLGVRDQDCNTSRGCSKVHAGVHDALYYRYTLALQCSTFESTSQSGSTFPMQYTVTRGRPTSPGALLGVFGAVYRDVSSPWWFGFCVRLSWPGACGLGGCLAKSAYKFSTMCCAAGPCVCTGACDRSGVASVLVLKCMGRVLLVVVLR